MYLDLLGFGIFMDVLDFEKKIAGHPECMYFNIYVSNNFYLLSFRWWFQSNFKVQGAPKFHYIDICIAKPAVKYA